MKIEYGVASKNYKYICLIADAILNMEQLFYEWWWMWRCGKIIFGTRRKSTDYWKINVRKFKCNKKCSKETKGKKHKNFFKQAKI